MEERDVFASHGAKKISHEGVVAAYGKGGAKFDRFDLTLPKGARIIREKHGTFRLETKRFSIRIESDVSFVNADVPWEFLARYLKKKHDVVNSFRCNHRWRCHSRLGGYCLQGVWSTIDGSTVSKILCGDHSILSSSSTTYLGR